MKIKEQTREVWNKAVERFKAGWDYKTTEVPYKGIQTLIKYLTAHYIA